jgi:2-aminoethylphosphonate aminotransferase
MTAPRKILLNPGPCTTTERVKDALVMSDLCPREKDFGDLLATVRSGLLAVAHAGDTHEAVVIAGSGTAAVESVLSSCVGPTDRVLIIDNGAYGRRAEQIAQAYGLAHRTLKLGWGEFPEPARIAAMLAEAPACTHCFLVHHETTTGMLNPLAEVSAICRDRGVSLIVDAMSSLGGVPLDVRATPMDYVISSANKCLQGMPGLAFVLVEKTALVRTAALPRRGVYLDLHAQWRAQENERQFLFTPPVQVLNALAVALAEYFAEGAAARHARYAACLERLVAGMERLGFVPLVPPPWRSGLLTAFYEPTAPAWSFDGLHDWLYARGITIYPGKIAATRTFRLATIGDLTPADIDVVIADVREFCMAHGVFAQLEPDGS